MRVAIIGGPRTGKTTLAKEMHRDTGWVLRQTDDLVSLGWSEASQYAADHYFRGSELIVEGVAVPRALRKWLEANPQGAPVDRVVTLWEEKVPRTKGQETMAKGVETVWRGIVGELRLRGVEVVDGDSG